MMIRNDSELREAQARLADLRDQAQRVRKELAQRGLGEDAVSIAIAPQSAMADDIAWEVDLYEQLKAGDVDAVPGFAPEERGKALICLRILKGWTQRHLAEALGVSEAVVSRDERNEYHGISLDKYGKVLTALGFVDHPRFVVKNDEEPVVQRRAMVIQFPTVWRQAASFIPPESLNLPPEPIHIKEV
jgi:transcriptional regulator with XRE-family HTH domain